MTDVRKDVDLEALARPRERIAPPRRRWLRIVLPAVIIAAFLFVLRDTLIDWIRPPAEVTVVRPRRIEGAPAPGGARSIGAAPALAVQAAGWVEPDPFPIFVPALAGGVLTEVLVQESDAVEAGATVARLVAADARLEHERARASVASAEAAVAAARARAEIAAERFDAALEVTEAAAAAAARRRGRESEAIHRAAAVREGEARLALAESEVVVQRELEGAGASGARQVEIAEAEVDVAEAALAALRADAALAEASREEAVAAEERAKKELTLRFADRLERDVAAAELARLEAELANARAMLGEAELRLARMEVVAPAGGVVLERLAADGEDLAAGEPVASLYDPASLRIRVDVPQGDVEKLFVGQAAEVLADSRPGRPYEGEVIRIVQRADIQKVTLEAQVRVDEADGLLRPDMLCQVRFLDARADGEERAGAASDEGSSGSAGSRIAIPRNVVRDGFVWIVDPVASVARRREVELGRTIGAGEREVEVLAGINPTDKLVSEGRAALDAAGDDGEGVRVRVRASSPSASGGDER